MNSSESRRRTGVASRKSNNNNNNNNRQSPKSSLMSSPNPFTAAVMEMMIEEKADVESSESNETTDETTKSVAVSSALVGESVLDSPTCIKGLSHSSFQTKHTIQPFSTAAASHQHDVDEDDDDKKSWVDRGLEWWQRRKEQRQREILTKLAQEQRRKILKSQAAPDVESSSVDPVVFSSLADNSTFQQLTNNTSADNDSITAAQEEENDHLSSMHASKSGQGVSVDLNFTPEKETAPNNNNNGHNTPQKKHRPEDDASFWIPEAEIEPHPSEIHHQQQSDDDDDDDEGGITMAPYLLEKSQRQAIAQLCLPQSLSYCKWIRIYSLARDGDSFDGFLRRVKGQLHTLLVVKTTKNEIFGGYADSPWQAQHQGNPEFYGSALACLYRLRRGETCRVYRWSGINRYIQFVDIHRKMMAFGGGGDEGAFGLCIEQDFCRGSTGTCATFLNEPLCTEENFYIVDVECYGFVTGKF